MAKRRRYVGLTLALALAASYAARADEKAVHRYTTKIDPALSTLEVSACFDGDPPARLGTSSSRAREYLSGAEHLADTGAVPLSVSSGGIRTRGLKAGSCIRYSVDLARAADARSSWRAPARRVGDNVLASPGIWLWRPPLAEREDIEITFDLPEGVSVSAPWTVVGHMLDRPVYRLGHTPDSWTAVVAFGRFSPQEVVVPGARLRVAILDGSPAPDLAALSAWVGEAASAVATLYGEFPVAAPQILVVPQAKGDEPVPWGQVMRGGGAAAHFYIDQRRPMPEFHADWTAAHELSHMLLPYVARADAWLSEGVASYYQNVLRARAGMLTPEKAWEKLDAGFNRGIRGTRGKPLKDVSRDMYRNRAFMRVYWSGAAIALLADVRLRQLTDNEQSLDTAFAGLKDCCLPSERMWSAMEVMTRFDAITGTTVFRDLYAEHVDSREFPDTTDIYRDIGLRVKGSRVRYDDNAPNASIREAIMHKPLTRARGATSTAAP